MLEFGTDGVRGRANSELNSEFALRLGMSVANTIAGSTFLVGRDTRVSGTMLQAAFSAGLAAAGTSVLDLGVIPSPGVAYLCSRLKLAGAVISASHNPYHDNGIKILGPAGAKLSNATEIEIERGVRDGIAIDEGVGTINDASHLVSDYLTYITSQPLIQSLVGLKLVLDTANGAASGFAREVFERYGASVVVINDSPDGVNINANAGSTHLQGLIDTVLAEKADLGLGFDGDADRVLAVAQDGSVIDGDIILGVLAKFLNSRSLLSHNGLAITVMSNMGLRIAMAQANIVVVETPVGDRHVFEAMERHGFVLGGEQSGHIILADLAATGDGMLTGAVFSRALLESGIAASELANRTMVRFPQILRNVACVGDPKVVLGAPEVKDVIARAAQQLSDAGRVLVRPSGTEPLIRVMVEARDEALATESIELILKVISQTDL